MDPTRFDAIARSVATPATRRAALGALTAGGLLGALGLGRGTPAAAASQGQGQNQNQGQAQGQGQGGLCVLAFVAMVREGPSAGVPLVAGGAPGELRGNLLVSLSPTGAFQNAALQLPDGSSLPVVGQATGNALELRVDFGQGRALVALGVGEQPVTQCLGPFDGPASGPQVGDLGEWHAAAGVQNIPGGAQAGSTQAGGARLTGGTAPAGGATAGGAGGGSAGGTRPSGGGSAGGAGACPTGQIVCDGACVDTRTDPNNCGGCGSDVCSDVATCVNGACALCEVGFSRCGNTCVDTTRDPNNCGACGNVCAAGACEGSACGCVGGRTACGGVCVDTTSDAANCSACGVACGADERCGDSLCQPINGGGGCKTGLSRCGTTCADVATDVNNCGRCGARCAAGEACTGGECRPAPAPAPDLAPEPPVDTGPTEPTEPPVDAAPVDTEPTDQTGGLDPQPQPEPPVDTEPVEPTEQQPLAPADGGAACLATGAACDPTNPGACCSGACNGDGTCA